MARLWTVTLWRGEVVGTGTALFTVSNVNRMWLTLSVRQEDAEYLSLGQTTLFRSGDKKNEPEIKGSTRVGSALPRTNKLGRSKFA